jgi:probable HAF family extracellular repeat protein
VTSSTCTCITAITLFFALTMPVRLGAQPHTRYKLVDLGTFGGPASAINIGSTSLDSRGIAVGAADTSVPTPPNSNPWPCFSAFVSHAFEWQNGVVTDLGTLAGTDNCSGAILVNASGETAGSSENGEIDALTGVTEIRAVRWKDGRIMDLGTFGGNHSAAQGINDRGQIVGFALSAIPDPYSFFDLGILGSSGGTETRAFLWQNEDMQDLGTLGGPDAFATFVNQRGQVAGQSYTNSTPNSSTGLPTQDPFLWENGRMIDLGTLGGVSGGPSGINSLGQVIGTSNLLGDVISHPFLWEEGVLKDLGTLGGDNGFPYWINDAGEIVGDADLPGSAVHHAFLWRNGVMTDLGSLATNSTAFAINSKHQTVGRSRIGATTVHATLWENGGPIIDLNTLIPANASLQLEEADGINDRGEIVGLGAPPGVPPNPESTGLHAFLLIPCDRDHADTKGCEDNAEVITALTQNSPAPLINSRPTSPRGGPTPSEIVAAWRTRMMHRHYIPGSGALQQD